jgi:hypothetical protein
MFRRDHEDIMHTHALDHVRHRLPAPAAPSALRGEAEEEEEEEEEEGSAGGASLEDETEGEGGENSLPEEEDARRFGHVKVPMATVVYDRRPGNHLDQQIKSGKFAHPMSEQHLYDTWHKAGPERGRQITEAIAAQESYLNRKIRALIAYERRHGVQVL